MSTPAADNTNQVTTTEKVEETKVGLSYKLIII